MVNCARPTARDIADVIHQSNSVRGALYRMKDNFEVFGGCDLAYEYFMWPWSYIRGDLLNATTLSKSVSDLYSASGGTNTDPIIDQVAKGPSFVEVRLHEVLSDASSKYFANPFFQALADKGCRTLAATCLPPSETIGHGAFTIFETREQEERRLPLHDMQVFVLEWHRELVRTGRLGAHFGVTPVEAAALEAVAAGRTAADMAERENVTVRTMEMRLQGARRKLNVRNSSEAVYKAVAHGLLPLSTAEAHQVK